MDPSIKDLINSIGSTPGSPEAENKTPSLQAEESEGLQGIREALKNLEAVTGASDPEALEESEALEDTKNEIITLKDLKRVREIQKQIEEGITGNIEVEALFLKAVEALSLLLGDKAYFEKLQEDFITVYGEGMLESFPLQKRFNEIELKKRKLEASIRRSKAPEGKQCQLKKLKLESLKYQEEELLRLQAEGQEIEEDFRKPVQLTFSACYTPKVSLEESKKEKPEE